MEKWAPTTKDVGLIRQLFEQGQITLAPEFQRNSIWPRAAKAYLIDSILKDRPIPLLYFRRAVSIQTGKPKYEVIDGQQRLRAILEFLDDRFSLTESTDAKLRGRKYSELSETMKDRILSYDLFVQELVGYSDADIRDMFLRMNRYVVKLSPQEIRHARGEGKFADFVEELGELQFWSKFKVFTKHQMNRMRQVEFAAELAILLIEGPQDKKKAVDLYYGQFSRSFPQRSFVEKRLRTYLDWVANEIANFGKTRFRKPVDLYGLIGALEIVTEEGRKLSKLTGRHIGESLAKFERETKARVPSGLASQYNVAASRQTDNVNPRVSRIRCLVEVLRW